MALPTTDSNIPLKVFKTKIKSLENKKIIQKIKQSSKTANKYLINMSQPLIIHLSSNCPLYKKIINMDIVKLNNIERNLKIKNKLDLKLMKTKMAFVNNILHELIKQNFDIKLTDFTKLFNNKKQSYNKNLNNLINNIKLKSFPKIIKEIEPFNFDLSNFASPQSSTDIDHTVCIEDTPSRLIVPCYTFYKRSLRTDVMGMLTDLVWNHAKHDPEVAV